MNRVRILRDERKLRQVELANMLNVSQATLSNWERGIHDPDNESLINLAKIFDCTVDYLICVSDMRYAPGVSEQDEMNQIFYRIIHEARNSGLDAHDLELAINLVKHAKEGNNPIGRGSGSDTHRHGLT